MEKGKKIMMVTFAPHPNFGTCLQSYALCYILRKMGHEVEFIYNNNDFYKRGFIGTTKDIVKKVIPQSLIEDFWRWKRRRKEKTISNSTKTNEINVEIHYPPIIKTLPNSKWAFYLSKLPIYPKLLKLYKYRTTQWKKVYSFTFLDGNYKMRRIYTTKQYEEVVNDADIFITGSDQIWNPYCYGYNPFMFLEFVNGRKKCIAYSSSISRPNFPPEVEERAKTALQKFEHIAVREQSSVKLLNKLLGRDNIRLVVDPTYLLSAKEWIDFGERANIEFTIPQKYIFCYFIGNRHKEYMDMVEDVKRKTGINDVITIDCTNCKVNYGNGILYKDGGPYEFVYLLSQASFICMDSFHATIFSIKFRKNFAHIFKTNDNYNSVNSQNTRIKDLLLRYHLEDHIYDEKVSDWLKPIDWDYIEKATGSEISESLLYLKESI